MILLSKHIHQVVNIINIDFVLSFRLEVYSGSTYACVLFLEHFHQQPKFQEISM